MKEYWKIINEYPDYMVSDLGNIKSLKYGKERILKKTISRDGYYRVTLSKNLKQKVLYIHQLVAIAFLNHIPNGSDIVIDHIDNDKLNNCVKNLQIVSHRFNISKGKKNNSSKYTGVSLYNPKLKWSASININKRQIALGRFKTELEAHHAYQKALNNSDLYKGNNKEFLNKLKKIM